MIQSKRRIPLEALVVSFSLVLTLVLFFKIDNYIESGLPAVVSPALFPRFILGICIITLTILLAQMAYNYSKQMRLAQEGTPKEPSHTEPSIKGFLVYLAIISLYYVAFSHVGFVFSTPCVMLVIAWMLNGRRFAVMIPGFILFTIAIDQITSKLMKIQLPTGISPW